MSRAYHWVAEVHKAMRTVIGDGLKQQLQAPQEVPHDIASLVAQIPISFNGLEILHGRLVGRALAVQIPGRSKNTGRSSLIVRAHFEAIAPPCRACCRSARLAMSTVVSPRNSNVEAAAAVPLLRLRCPFNFQPVQERPSEITLHRLAAASYLVQLMPK